MLVEKMLEGEYKKWNTNSGGVDGQDKEAAMNKLAAVMVQIDRVFINVEHQINTTEALYYFW